MSNENAQPRIPLRAWHVFVLLALVVVLVFLFNARLAQAITRHITLDGQFQDWEGQAHVNDPRGDASLSSADLKAFYLWTDLKDETHYFMAEFWGRLSTPVTLSLLVDTNGDGIYGQPVDRVIGVYYQPDHSEASVDTWLTDGTGTFLGPIASGSDWGERVGKAAHRVEWSVSYSQLGIVTGQMIRMRLKVEEGGVVSDTANEVQWSPADALGIPLLVVLTLAGATWLALQREHLNE